MELIDAVEESLNTSDLDAEDWVVKVYDYDPSATEQNLNLGSRITELLDMIKTGELRGSSLVAKVLRFYSRHWFQRCWYV